MSETDDDNGTLGGITGIRSDDDDPIPEASDAIDTDDLDWEKLMENGHQPDVIDLHPPDLAGSGWGIIGDFLLWKNRRRKEKKLAKKGYIRWHLVDGTWSTPKYVKPEQMGGGIRELKHDGIRYLFPENSKLPDPRSGMWTYVHKKGEAQPLNLNDPSKLAIQGDELDKYITNKVTSDPPSFWDKLDVEGDFLIKGAVAAIILVAVMQRVVTML